VNAAKGAQSIMPVVLRRGAFKLLSVWSFFSAVSSCLPVFKSISGPTKAQYDFSPIID
jgi:hypothetical protein